MDLPNGTIEDGNTEGRLGELSTFGLLCPLTGPLGKAGTCAGARPKPYGDMDRGERVVRGLHCPRRRSRSRKERGRAGGGGFPGHLEGENILESRCPGSARGNALPKAAFSVEEGERSCRRELNPGPRRGHPRTAAARVDRADGRGKEDSSSVSPAREDEPTQPGDFRTFCGSFWEDDVGRSGPQNGTCHSLVIAPCSLSW